MKQLSLWVLSALLLAGSVLGVTQQSQTAHAQSTTSISIPVTEIVRNTGVGSITEIASASVTSNLIGRSCSVSTQAENQGSIHPGNNLIVASNGTSVTLADVERAAGVLTTANGMLTLGNTVTVSLEMGQDDVFSAGIDVTVTCEDPIQVCRDGVETTINPEDRLPTDTDLPCPIEVCRDGEPTTINPDERRDTDIELPCPEEEVERCVDGVIKSVPVSKADQYETECPSEQIEVCRDGEIVTIDVDAKLDTDTEAPCPEEQVQVCRDGVVITVDKSDVRESDLVSDVCPQVLPETGAGSTAALILAIGAAAFAGQRYIASRSRLAKATLR